ncbi:MAG TPA: hypothetical protein VMJ10_00865 [Kofleriaceae bacterium]|nr:hypothetical protein [Kofleriaceae bacterium]
MTPLAPLVAGLFGIAVGATLGYGKPIWRVIAAMAAVLPLVAMQPSWPVLAIVASAAGLGLAVGGARGIRGALAVMIGAAVVLLALWTALRIGHAQRTATWPAWATDLASAAALGMVGVIAVIPRHLRISLDPVQAALRALPRELDAEVRELCDRSVAIWRGASEKLGDGDPGRNLVRDGVLKTLEVAARSAEMRSDGTSDEALAKRMTDLDARIAAASDAEVRAQYQAARAALDDQRRYRDQIRGNRERVIARLHNHVAALEKFQLAASGLEAARAASAGAPVIKQLEELSSEVAASGEALAEVI